jgi:hypothetical protein
MMLHWTTCVDRQYGWPAASIGIGSLWRCSGVIWSINVWILLAPRRFSRGLAQELAGCEVQIAPFVPTPGRGAICAPVQDVMTWFGRSAVSGRAGRARGACSPDNARPTRAGSACDGRADLIAATAYTGTAPERELARCFSWLGAHALSMTDRQPRSDRSSRVCQCPRH